MKIYVLETKDIFADKDNPEIIYTEGSLLATKDLKRVKDLTKRCLVEVLGVLDTSSTAKTKDQENESTDNQDDKGEQTSEDQKENSTNKTKSKNSNSKK